MKIITKKQAREQTRLITKEIECVLKSHGIKPKMSVIERLRTKLLVALGG